MIDQDEQILGMVGTAFEDVHLDRDESDVIGRGRRIRRRRHAVPVLAAAGIVAASLSLAAVTQTGGGTVVNVDEAAFSVHTNAKTGGVTVTIFQLDDEAQLKKVLGEAGIPSVFYSTVSPTSVPLEACRWTGVSGLRPQHVFELIEKGITAFTVYPARMPKGSVLAFDYITVLDGAGPGAGGTHRMSSGGVMFGLLSGKPTSCRVTTG